MSAEKCKTSRKSVKPVGKEKNQSEKRKTSWKCVNECGNVWKCPDRDNRDQYGSTLALNTGRIVLQNWTEQSLNYG
jgi:hypothetical protein